MVAIAEDAAALSSKSPWKPAINKPMRASDHERGSVIMVRATTMKSRREAHGCCHIYCSAYGSEFGALPEMILVTGRLANMVDHIRFTF